MPNHPAERLAVGLNPRTPEVEAIVARRVVELAAEIGDLDLLDAITDEVEHPSRGVHATDLAARAGISYRQLDWWTAHGYLDALPRASSGSGYVRHYSTEAVLKARIMGSLVNRLHMAPAAAAETAAEILATGRAQVGPFVVTKRAMT